MMQGVKKVISVAVCVCVLGACSVVTAAQFQFQETPLNRELFNYFSYQEGMARVVENRFFQDNYGYVDVRGEEVIPCMYLNAADFSEGLAAVQDVGGLYGYINPSGAKVLDYQFDSASSFSEGLACVTKDGKRYFINHAGEMVLDVTAYEDVDHFSGGLAAVTKNGKQGFMDRTGKEVIPCMYDSVVNFGQDGIGFGVMGNTAYAFSTTGQQLFQVTCDAVFAYSDGLAKIQQNGRVGYMDTNGTMVIPCMYDNTSLSFSEGLAYVQNGTVRGYINKDGQMVLDMSSYDYAGSFCDGYALAQKGDKSYYVDMSGNTSGGYDNAVALREGIALAQKGDQVYVLRTAPSQWAQSEVQRAIDLKLVPNDLQVNYQAYISREEFCELLAQMLEVRYRIELDELVEAYGGKEVAFTDTDSEMVEGIAALGIVSGRGDGVFDPDGRITRQEAAVMLANTIKVFGTEKIGTAVGTFRDQDSIASWAVNGVTTVSQLGIMGTTGNNEFSPLGTYSREQAIVTVLRVYDVLKK